MDDAPRYANNKLRDPVIDAAIEKMADEGYICAEIATKLGISNGRVRNWFVHHGRPVPRVDVKDMHRFMRYTFGVHSGSTRQSVQRLDRETAADLGVLVADKKTTIADFLLDHWLRTREPQ